MRRRGQTTQDFAVGASVFLLTMAFVFALIPTVFAPFQTPVDSADTVASQRIADSVHSEITDEGVTLNGTDTTAFFGSTTGEDLRKRYGLSRSAHVNVTLVGDGRSVGDVYRDEPVVISRRVAVNESMGCEPCQIEVRIW